MRELGAPLPAVSLEIHFRGLAIQELRKCKIDDSLPTIVRRERIGGVVRDWGVYLQVYNSIKNRLEE